MRAKNGLLDLLCYSRYDAGNCAPVCTLPVLTKEYNTIAEILLIPG